MTSTLRKLRAGIMTAGVVGALGFGAMQAFATDPPRNPPLSVVPCDTEACDRVCQVFFPGPITSGFCGPEGECRCAV